VAARIDQEVRVKTIKNHRAGTAGRGGMACWVWYFCFYHPAAITNLGMIMKNVHAKIAILKTTVVTAAPTGDAALSDQTAEKIHPATITAPIPPKNADAHNLGNGPTLPCEI